MAVRMRGLEKVKPKARSILFSSAVRARAISGRTGPNPLYQVKCIRFSVAVRAQAINGRATAVTAYRVMVRRARTALASTSRVMTVSSQPMQASVIDWPCVRDSRFLVSF